MDLPLPSGRNFRWLKNPETTEVQSQDPGLVSPGRRGAIISGLQGPLVLWHAFCPHDWTALLMTRCVTGGLDVCPTPSFPMSTL